MPLFSGVRGKSCIELSPRAVRMASEALHAAWEETTCCGGA
jgi:hypothetical protein